MNYLENENVQTWFKANPPYTEIEGKFGYRGVVLYNKLEDKLQCHECGEWVEHLPSHIWNRHKIKNKDYRMTYGLPLTYPLVNKKISSYLSELGEKNGIVNHMKGKFNKTAYLKGKAKGKLNKASMKYYRNCEAFHNKLSICEKQVNERYIVLAESLGHEPTDREIVKFDPKLKDAIRKWYKNLNGFRKNHGYEIKNGFNEKYSQEKVIGLLRMWIEKNHCIPNSKNLLHSSPTIATVKKYCGSLRKALHLAGFEAEYQQEFKRNEK